MFTFTLFRRKVRGSEELLKLARHHIELAKQAGTHQHLDNGLEHFRKAVDYTMKIFSTSEIKQNTLLSTKAKSLLFSLVFENKEGFYTAPDSRSLSLACYDPLTIAKMIKLDIQHYQRWLNKQEIEPLKSVTKSNLV